tara:strand:- start:158 stop:322 length:165 start_codon:yes stop_codon:yes gene_type:complete
MIGAANGASITQLFSPIVSLRRSGRGGRINPQYFGLRIGARSRQAHGESGDKTK